MKILEGRRTLNSGEGILLIASAVFFVMCFVIFVRRDESSGVRAKSLVEDVKTTVESVELKQNEIRNESKVTTEAFTAAIGNLSQRVEILERKPSFQNVSLKVEPIEVVYKTPEVLSKKVKPGLPLSKKAGLIPKENN